MRKITNFAAVLLFAAAVAIPTIAVGQDGDIGDDDGVVSVFKKADDKKKFKFPLKAYVMSGIFCSAATNIADSVITGATEQRQLTPKKALANTIGCFTFGIGGLVYLALNPENPADIYAARIAWRYDNLPWRQQQLLLALGAKEPITYPTLAQMEQALGEGPKIKKRLKKRRWRR